MALIEAAKQLDAAGVPSPRTDAELLASHLLGVERTRLGLIPLVDPEVIAAFDELVAQRVKRIPLQHIIGVASMGNIDVAVGPGVFIPRPETELLMGWALSFLEGCGSKPPVVLDLCTGSGVLALSIAEARPDAVVHAVEKEPAALASALGWTRVRTLLQMRRSLTEPLPVVRIHAGYKIRTFLPTDAQAWLNPVSYTHLTLPTIYSV